LEVRSYWEQHISDAKKGTGYVTLKKKTGTDHLSKNEIKTLTEVDERFGHMTWSALVDYCHKLPEWKDRGKSSAAIAVEEILSAVGKTGDEISQIRSHAMESAWLDLILSNKVAA